MKVGEEFMLKYFSDNINTTGKTEEELFNLRKDRDYFSMVFLPHICYLNDGRCSSIFRPKMVNASNGFFYESYVRFLEGKREFDKKYHPNFFQKHIPTFENIFHKIKGSLGYV
ncbi:MAG: hypothetical protein AABW81_03745 [Nanoarchaeota archaeon]